MKSPFHDLSRPRLTALADALEAGRLAPPFTEVALQRYAPGPDTGLHVRELQKLSACGVQPGQLAYLLRAIVAEREVAQRTTDRVELVWTGPEQPASSSRDTGVVVRELFAAARQYVDIAGFAVYNGREVFRTLAENMSANTGLVVRLFLNIGRRYPDPRNNAQVVEEFIDAFVEKEWPTGVRRPALYYDPRSLSTEPGARASLHAKCIVVDDRSSFITSANFTEAAQERNIEAGILIEDAHLARGLRRHLSNLVEGGFVHPVDQT